MSTVYADAIAALERDRGALQGQLDRIDIALTSLRELQGPTKATEKVGRSVGRSVQESCRRPAKPKTRRATVAPPDDQDARIVAFVNQQRGVRLSAVAEMLKCDPGPLRYRMKQLVAAGQMTNFGRAHAAKYWPAGTTAKEAL